MNLGEMLRDDRDGVVHRWTEKIRPPGPMARPELVDHVPQFLEEIAQWLEASESPDRSSIAARHGLQRLALGFNLDTVVREYGALREAIMEEAGARGVAISPEEREILVDCTITGIADAVTEYSRQRDAELQRQANEHFAFVAHELRNPLATAVTALDVMRETKAISNDRLAGILDRGLGRMHDLIERSLRLAQIGFGITIHREATSLRALIDDVELAVAATAAARNVSVHFHLEGDVQVEVDVRLFHSALTNLVRNAVKFTGPGTQVEIRATVDNQRLLVEVEDQCGGLPSGAAERAFAPFVQLGADRSGFGLGLAIARQAVEAHGGTIRARNLPEKGCIFAFEIPITG